MQALADWFREHGASIKAVFKLEAVAEDMARLEERLEQLTDEVDYLKEKLDEREEGL